MVGYASAPLCAAALAAAPLACAYVPFPDPPQPLPHFPPSYDMFASSIIMPCNYTGPFESSVAAQWGIADIDWSNSKAQWVQNHPMTSEEELVTAASSIRAVSNRTKVWVYRNLVYAPSWFTEVREKLVSHPQWFIPFKKDGPYVNSKCTLGKCSDLFHSQFQTPEYHSGSVMFGDCLHEHCDCGELPCGWYLWNHSVPECREWLVKEHMMGAMSMGNADVQGNFIDDEWFEYGPELEGPGSESISKDIGFDRSANLAMQAYWRLTMDAANAAVIAADGYTWRAFVLLVVARVRSARSFALGESLALLRSCAPSLALSLAHTSRARANTRTVLTHAAPPGLFYNNGTCAQSPFVGSKNTTTSECQAYMEKACSPEAPLEKNALFYGFSGMTGCSPDPPSPAPTTMPTSAMLAGRDASRSGRTSNLKMRGGSPPSEVRQRSSADPIIDKLQHLASFLLIRGPYAWLGWAWLGCGNFPYRPPELDVDYGTPLETCHAAAGSPGVFVREYTKASIRVDCNHWEATITPKSQ